MSLFGKMLCEFVGTLLIVYIGDCVVANNNLQKSNAKGFGVLAIDLGWFAAVAIPAVIFIDKSGAFNNPAVALAFAIRGDIPMTTCLLFIVAEVAGAFVGAFLVYLTFIPQFDATEDQGAILSCFTTGPAVDDVKTNILAECIGTFFLIIGVFEIAALSIPSYFKAFMIAFLVFGLCVCMGGVTGCSINPARDVGPRLFHGIAPIKNKGTSNWHYGWRPVVGQFIASFLAVGAYALFHAIGMSM